LWCDLPQERMVTTGIANSGRPRRQPEDVAAAVLYLASPEAFIRYGQGSKCQRRLALRTKTIALLKLSVIRKVQRFVPLSPIVSLIQETALLVLLTLYHASSKTANELVFHLPTKIKYPGKYLQMSRPTVLKLIELPALHARI
jgi:hypothetical protein